jgi:hypothetical protein
MRSIRGSVFDFGLAMLLSCCGGMTHDRGASNDSETHFLMRCDGECPGDLGCLCGVCTVACERDALCDRFGDVASCRPLAGEPACSDAAPASVCEVTCERDADCASVGPEHLCMAGACRLAMSAPGTRTCGTDSMPLQVEPKIVEWSTVYASLVTVVRPHALGLAFVDNTRRLMFLRDGSLTPELVWEVPSEDRRLLSFATDDQAIYWITSRVDTSVPPGTDPFMPPSTVERAALDGSGHAVLFESETMVVHSISVDGEAVYFADRSGGTGLYRMGRQGGDAVPVIPRLRVPFQRDGDTFYWVDENGLSRGDRDGNVELLLPRGDDPAIDLRYVMRTPSGDLLLVLLLGPEGMQTQTIARYDVTAGCLRVYALTDDHIGGVFVDHGAVYWEGLQSDPETLPRESRLWRTDLSTGETMQLLPQGLDMMRLNVVGQGANVLYALNWDTRELVQIAK